MRTRRRACRHRNLLMALVALALIMLVECSVFNAAFWSTLTASTDTDAVTNTLGPGLRRTPDGMLEVTNETSAYLEVNADGTSRYARVDALPIDADAAPHRVRLTAHLRADSDGHAGSAQSVSFTTPQSLYLHVNAASRIRVWVQEPRGTLLPLEAVRANVHVPFHVDWLRVAIMSVLTALVLLWRPRSTLWDIRLNPASRRQRWLFAAFAIPAGIVTLAAIVLQLRNPVSLVFHTKGGYTYDFDIYGHMADALLHGHLWLDLPVPNALRQVPDLYDTAVREHLLSQGVSPIYWDYAWYDGHWYSYFGVLPALMLFAPYRLISSLWTPGGAMLPAAAAVQLLTYGFLLIGSLLVIRVVHRMAPRASLAATSMAVTLMVVGSNIGYLALRTNFYSVPFVAAMTLSALGIFLWLGACSNREYRHGRWQIEGAPPISLPGLAGGTLAIAATLACRPTFTLTALLGIPIFWPQIRMLIRRGNHRYRSGSAASLLLCVLVPAGVFAVGVGLYNTRRFGSPLDFGIKYQLTVTDMTSYPISPANILKTVGYYLALPLQFTRRFPFLAISPTPLPQWGFAEPMIGGLLIICPLLVLSFLIPLLRRALHRNGVWRLLMSCWVLGLLLIAVDSVAGGLGWRYMADFGWLFSLASIGVMLVVLDEVAPRHPYEDVVSSRQRQCHAVYLWCIRLVMLVALLVCLSIGVLSIFVLGRDDALIRTNPALFYTFQSWFALL